MGAVVFDMDGTVLDSERLVYSVWKRVGPEFGFNTIDTLFFDIIGTTAEHTRTVFEKEYGENIPYKEFRDEARRVYFKTVGDSGIPLKPGAEESLKTLKNAGFKIALASSTSIATVTREMKETGLYYLFDTVIGGDMIKNGKPDPEIFLLACKKLNADPTAAYAVEDSYNGIRAAHAAGMKAIMVPDMIAPDEEMERLAYAVKHDLYEAAELIMNEKHSGGGNT